MFRELYDMLKRGPHYNVSEEVEILKGFYAKINTISDVIEKNKRRMKWQK